MSDPRLDSALAKLIELYVLFCIGHLPAERERLLEQLAPRLGATYDRTGTWDEVLAAELEFPKDLPERLQALWESAPVMAPEEFAHRWLVANFSEPNA